MLLSGLASLVIKLFILVSTFIEAGQVSLAIITRIIFSPKTMLLFKAHTRTVIVFFSTYMQRNVYFPSALGLVHFTLRNISLFNSITRRHANLKYGFNLKYNKTSYFSFLLQLTQLQIFS